MAGLVRRSSRLSGRSRRMTVPFGRSLASEALFETQPTRMMFRVDGTGDYVEALGTAMSVPDTNRVVHTVTINGLTADTTYQVALPAGAIQTFYYTYHGDACTGVTIHWQTTRPIRSDGYLALPIDFSTAKKVFTAPATLGPSDVFRVGQVSDCHGGFFSPDIFRDLAAFNPHLVYSSGDIATGDGGLAGPSTWYRHFAAMNELIDSQGRHIPFQVVLGNHEIWNGRNGVGHQNSAGQKPDFDAPSRGDAEWYYCFWPYFPGLRGFGLVDFGDYLTLFQIDPGITTLFNDPADDQMQWLVDEGLARKNVPHKIATWHYPAWPPGRRNTMTYLRTRLYCGAAAFTAGIRIVGNGHDHNAYWSHPMADFWLRAHQDPNLSAVAPRDGIRFIGAGPAGASIREGRLPETKLWIGDSRAGSYERFDFEIEGELTEQNPSNELRDIHPNEGRAGAADEEVRNFWLHEFTTTGRTHRGFNLGGDEWATIAETFTDPVNVITPVVMPKLSRMQVGDTIAGALSANYDQISNYSSSAGDIVSVDTRIRINPWLQAEFDATTSDLTAERINLDVVQLTVTVTDDAGNSWDWIWGQEVREPVTPPDLGLDLTDPD